MSKKTNEIGKVLVVAGSRGGVGNSVVSSLLALGIARWGLKVGLLEADVSQPSVGRYFGLGSDNQGNTTPAVTEAGIKIMTADRLLPKPENQVIRPGAAAAEVVKRLWADVDWGYLDYLIVDLPSGADDIAVAVMETLPVSGIIMVASPLETTAMVSRQAQRISGINGARPIALIENLRHLKLPTSAKELELSGFSHISLEALTKLQSLGTKNVPIFGVSQANEMATALGVPLLTRIPYDPVLARFCDDGQIERYTYGSLLAVADTLGGLLGDPGCNACSCNASCLTGG